MGYTLSNTILVGARQATRKQLLLEVFQQIGALMATVQQLSDKQTQTAADVASLAASSAAAATLITQKAAEIVDLKQQIADLQASAAGSIQPAALDALLAAETSADDVAKAADGILRPVVIANQ